MGIIAERDDVVEAFDGGELRLARRPLALAPAGALLAGAWDGLRELGGEVTLVARAGLVTDDGERAAMFTLQTGAMQVTLGLVYGDRAVHRVSAIARRPEAYEPLAARARARVQGARLGLPWARPRDFHYPPPARWEPRRGDRAVTWRSPDSLGKIIVYAALPDAGAPPPKLARGRLTELAFSTPRGLEGQLTIVEAPGAEGPVLEWVELRDGQLVYAVMLETCRARLADHRAALARLVDGIEPVPRPRRAAGALAHWAA